MNALQAFVLSFALDGDEIVSKGIKKMSGEADKLSGSLDKTDKGLSKTEQGAKKTGQAVQVSAQNFMQLARQAAGALAPLYALSKVLNQTLDFAKQGEGVLFMAQSANTAAESFQKLANAAKMFGGTSESMSGILANFSGQMQAMKFGENTALQSAAIKYGISLRGANGLANPQEMLENIARRMESLAPEAQLDLGRMVGLDEATIRLLQGGVSGLRKELELASKYTLFSKEDLENARRFERTSREVKMALAALWGEISRALLPILQRVGEAAISVINYFREHSDFIKGGLLAISAILAAIAIKSLIAFAPLWGVAAVIAGIVAGFALLYDDFMTWAKGGESALAPLWETLVDIGRWFQDAPEWIKNVIESITGMINPINALKKAWSGLGGAADLMNSGKELLLNARAKINEADINPLSAIGKGDISNAFDNSSREVNVENNFTINGATSPMQTAQQVQKEINPLFQLVSGRL